jgi:2-methylisocitrate lyase-like PEP mutase family enzyme
MSDTARRAERLLALHHEPELLVLPNIWDPLGARLLESLGFPAVATASAAVAFSLGYDDGQRIRFEAMLEVVRRIVESVGVPVTADVESGYAREPEDVARNVRDVLRAGAAGINLEDSDHAEGGLLPIELQCARIQAVRAMADREGVPLVVNARIDTFMHVDDRSHEERLRETVERGKAYADAGADCLYPITVGDLESLRVLLAETRAPINVYAGPSTAAMRDLEAAGVSRLSVGPGLLRASVTAMKRIAEDLRDHGSYEAFTTEVLSSDEIRRLVSAAPMPDRG